MKFLILTTDDRTLNWCSLPKKIEEIQKALTDIWEIEIIPFYGKVHIDGDRVDREWLGRLSKSYFDEGYDVIALHMSLQQKKDWKIKPTLNGANPNRKNEVGDFYFWSDERTKHFRGGGSQFVQTCLHEFAHEYYDQTKIKDATHSYHEAFPDIKGLFKTFDWSKYQPKRRALRRIKNLLTSVVILLELLVARKKSTGLLHPVKDYEESISQAYGIANLNFYPSTGHHIGTDYACPVGTPVVAPFDGEVTSAGYSSSLGNHCFFTYKYLESVYVVRMMHLSKVPRIGNYKQGILIEKSGATGNVTGPHLHIDIWLNEVRLDLINGENWDTMTVDPYYHFKQK